MSLARLNTKLKRHPVLGEARVWAWVAPGNVPDPIILAVTAARLRGAELILKLSRRNEALGRALVRKHVSPKQKVRTVVGYPEFRKLAADADAWVVYGSDATLAAMKKLKPAAAGWVGHGHRMSLNILFRSALGSAPISGSASAGRARPSWTRLVRACARDIRTYDQQGCLSPQIIWVQGEAAAERFAHALLSELIRLESDTPTRRDPETARLRRTVLDELRVRSLDPRELDVLEAPRDAIRPSAGSQAPVVYRLRKGNFLTPAAGQVVAVKSFGSVAEIVKGMRSFRSHLQGIGTAGSAAERRAVREAFSGTTAVYFPRVGRLQTPPLDWNL